MTAPVRGHRENQLKVPIIDLFAGPGGLSEGFAAHSGQIRFEIALSIEKDLAAHRTLLLRSFVRQFRRGCLPNEYYQYVTNRAINLDELFKAHPKEAERACSIAWQAELGKEPYKNVHLKLHSALGNCRHTVILGGPPCQAYSLMGRARMGKMEKFASDHRHTLYREYLKILAAVQPTVFVMENVKGILSSKHKDEAIFGRILADMCDPWSALSVEDRKIIPEPTVRHGYKIYSFSHPLFACDMELSPKDYLIESESYALPQKRHRVILLGIRDDYAVLPAALEPANEVVTVRDIIAGMPPLRSRLSTGDTNGHAWRTAVRRGSAMCRSDAGSRHRGFGTVIKEMLSRIPDNFGVGGAFVPGACKPKRLSNWIYDPMLGGVLQHEARGHMESDLHRYFFAACFVEKYGVSPKLEDFPKVLFPAHKNAVIGESGKVENFADRFRVQRWDDAATTITSHIAKDGHYFIHPDPLQCRSLTVREAARLQTFPDNYFFEGTRTEQYHQIGNAVPPFLAFQLADIVSDVLRECLEQDRKSGRGQTGRIIIGKA